MSRAEGSSQFWEVCFRGHVVGCSSCCRSKGGLKGVAVVQLCKAEVGELQVSACVNEEVFWFQVAMNENTVDFLKRQHQLCEVEACGEQRQRAERVEALAEVTAGEVLHEDEQTAAVQESRVGVGEEATGEKT